MLELTLSSGQTKTNFLHQEGTDQGFAKAWYSNYKLKRK